MIDEKTNTELYVHYKLYVDEFFEYEHVYKK